MLVEVKVPQLSESVAEATLLSWHKQPGEFVKRDENLVDIETDKVVLETPAPQAGVLVKIIKGDGGTVASNEVIAQIDTEAAKPADGGKTTAAAAAGGGDGSKPPIAPASKAAAPAMKGSQKQQSAPAMPAAQKHAAEKQVDTSSIAGTGRGGRVTKGDVLQAAAENDQGKPRVPPVPPSSKAQPQTAPQQQRAPAPTVDL